MTNVAVIGAGCLGLKIAGTLAFYGCKVWMFDSDSKVLNAAQQKIEQDINDLWTEGLLKSSTYLGELYYVHNLETAVRNADFIFECVPEDLNIKQQVFQNISRLCEIEAVIATSAMHLKCDDVIKSALHKNRCLGVRFLYPVLWIPDVEVTPCHVTSTATLEKVRLFLKKLDKFAYFRSQPHPLVLGEEQIQDRKAAFKANFQSNFIRLKNLNIQSTELSTGKSKPSTLCCQSDSQRGKLCEICMNEDRNCAYIPCGHFCSCYNCGLKILEKDNNCPLCRVPIDSILQIYNA